MRFVIHSLFGWSLQISHSPCHSGAAKAEPGIQTLGWIRMKRNMARFFLNSQRFWIPGSAMRPRNDEEGVKTVEKIKNSLKTMLGVKDIRSWGFSIDGRIGLP